MAPGSLLPFAEKLVLAEAVGQRPHMQTGIATPLASLHLHRCLTVVQLVAALVVRS